MTPQEWPVGIDLVGRYWHWAMRTLARGDKLAIEKLAAESADVGCFDIAAAVYMAERPKTYPQHPGVRGLRRPCGCMSDTTAARSSLSVNTWKWPPDRR
jgi:hypothetical protein